MTFTRPATTGKNDFAKGPELAKRGPRTEASQRAFEELRSRLNIARHLVSERIRRDLTQADVASAAGTRQSRVSELESGMTNFRFGTLDRVARALGLEVTLERRAARTHIEGHYVSAGGGWMPDGVKVTSARVLRFKDGSVIRVPPSSERVDSDKPPVATAGAA